MAKTEKSIDKYHRTILTTDNVVNLLLNNNVLDGVYCSDEEEVAKFEENSEAILGEEFELGVPELDYSVDEFHASNIESWYVPEAFFDIDVKSHLIALCDTQTEIDRINMEMEMFEERGLIKLLQVFMFLVETMTENKVVWGVGRGSSVASYCLYKIGIHRIDSLKYELDIKEFLK